MGEPLNQYLHHTVVRETGSSAVFLSPTLCVSPAVPLLCLPSISASSGCYGKREMAGIEMIEAAVVTETERREIVLPAHTLSVLHPVFTAVVLCFCVFHCEHFLSLPPLTHRCLFPHHQGQVVSHLHGELNMYTHLAVLSALPSSPLWFSVCALVPPTSVSESLILLIL